eukprot:495767_1
MTAPLAPQLEEIRKQQKERFKEVEKLEKISEQQNYQQLKWNDAYNEYYGREWKDETIKYLSDKIDSLENLINYKWYKYVDPNNSMPPSLRGHSLSDIGNDHMLTIGDHVKAPKIDIYKINKYFNTFEKLQSNGPVPCCRFAHSAQYIPMLNSILFFAGFDSKCNFNDARLLCLTNMLWYNLKY